MPVLFHDNMETEKFPLKPVIKSEPTDETEAPVRYPCDSCDEFLPTIPLLQAHIKTHVNQARPYECQDCFKRFSSSSGLKQHQHIHSSVKPFTCDVCQKSYTQFSNLCRHKRMHPECRQSSVVGNRTMCIQCGADFNSLTSLAKHQRFCTEKGKDGSNIKMEMQAQMSQSMPQVPFPMFPSMVPIQRMPPMITDYKTVISNSSQLSPNSSSSSEIEETEVRPIDQSPRFDVRRVRPDVPIVKPIQFDQRFLGWSPSKYQQDQPFDLSKKSIMSPLKIRIDSPIKPMKLNMDYCYDQPLDLSVKKAKFESVPSPKINLREEADVDIERNTPSPHIDVVSTDDETTAPLTPPPQQTTVVKNEPNLLAAHNHHLLAMHRMLQKFSPIKSANSMVPLQTMVPLPVVPQPSMVSPPIVDTKLVPTATSSPNSSPSPTAIVPELGTNYSQREPTKMKGYHPCPYCGKVFPRGANLSRHLRTHTGEKPFKCEFCSRQFSIGSNLKRHIQNVHDKFRVQCIVCEKTFGDKSNLDRHVEMKHGLARPLDTSLVKVVGSPRKETETVAPEAEIVAPNAETVAPVAITPRAPTPETRTQTPESVPEHVKQAQVIEETVRVAPECAEKKSVEVEDDTVPMDTEEVQENEKTDVNNNSLGMLNKAIDIKDIYPNFPESDDEDCLYIDC